MSRIVEKMAEKRAQIIQGNFNATMHILMLQSATWPPWWTDDKDLKFQWELGSTVKTITRNKPQGVGDAQSIKTSAVRMRLLTCPSSVAIVSGDVICACCSVSGSGVHSDIHNWRSSVVSSNVIRRRATSSARPATQPVTHRDLGNEHELLIAGHTRVRIIRGNIQPKWELSWSPKKPIGLSAQRRWIKSIVSNQPPVSFQADREHDNSHFGSILPRKVTGQGPLSHFQQMLRKRKRSSRDLLQVWFRCIRWVPVVFQPSTHTSHTRTQKPQMHTHTHAHSQADTHTQTHVHTRRHTHAHTHTRTHTHTHTHTEHLIWFGSWGVCWPQNHKTRNACTHEHTTHTHTHKQYTHINIKQTHTHCTCLNSFSSSAQSHRCAFTHTRIHTHTHAHTRTHTQRTGPHTHTHTHTPSPLTHTHTHTHPLPSHTHTHTHTHPLPHTHTHTHGAPWLYPHRFDFECLFCKGDVRVHPRCKKWFLWNYAMTLRDLWSRKEFYDWTGIIFTAWVNQLTTTTTYEKLCDCSSVEHSPHTVDVFKRFTLVASVKGLYFTHPPPGWSWRCGHVVTSRRVASRHVTSRHVTSRRVASRRVAVGRLTSRHVTSRRVASRRVARSLFCWSQTGTTYWHNDPHLHLTRTNPGKRKAKRTDTVKRSSSTFGGSWTHLFICFGRLFKIHWTRRKKLPELQIWSGQKVDSLD